MAQLEVADAAAGTTADEPQDNEQLMVQAAAQNSSKRSNILPLELVEALLEQYPQQQQQQQDSQQGPSSNTGELGLLPKEVFIKQLVETACIDGGEKLVIFSESLTVLDALEVLLQREFGYKLEQEYVRLEGKTGAEERRRLIKNFNNKQLVKVGGFTELIGHLPIWRPVYFVICVPSWSSNMSDWRVRRVPR